MIWFAVLLSISHLFLISAVVGGKEFNWQIANTSVWLSAAAYCDVNTLMIRNYEGYSKGFQAIDVICYADYDVQGIIGVMESQQSIYIVFRGSSTMGDWINDLDFLLTSYPLCKECQVHDGFYYAEQGVLLPILQTLEKLILQYPTYNIIFTGHSLGAAMATLTSLDAIHYLQDKSTSNTFYMTNHPERRIQLVNFGSPRIGNQRFAEFATKVFQEQMQASDEENASVLMKSFAILTGSQEVKLSTNLVRITHNRDVVPHLPFHSSFQHIAGEWFVDDSGTLRACDGYEDPHCAFQYYYLTVEDHMNYLNVHLSCASVTSAEEERSLEAAMKVQVLKADHKPKKCNYGESHRAQTIVQNTTTTK